jgi:hypothetical protein
VSFTATIAFGHEVELCSLVFVKTVTAEPGAIEAPPVNPSAIVATTEAAARSHRADASLATDVEVTFPVELLEDDAGSLVSEFPHPANSNAATDTARTPAKFFFIIGILKKI